LPSITIFSDFDAFDIISFSRPLTIALPETTEAPLNFDSNCIATFNAVIVLPEILTILPPETFNVGALNPSAVLSIEQPLIVVV